MNKIWIWIIVIVVVLIGGYWLMNRGEETPAPADGTASDQSAVSGGANVDVVIDPVSGN